jgi:hypothetical protein
MRALALALVMVAASACTSRTPTAPSAPAAPAPVAPAPASVLVRGLVTATNGGHALAGLAARVGSIATATDPSGAFAASLSPQTSVTLALTGATIVPRTIRMAAMTSRDVSADAIVLDGTFDLAFYRQLVRGGSTSRPLRRWMKAPQIYLRTVDDTGAAIEARTLDVTAGVLREMVPIWTAGTYGATVERGPDSRKGQVGWVTIHWSADAGAGHCGAADVAVEGGTIELFPRAVGCRCANGPEISPRTVRHEVGHAMGFFHTGDAADLMSGLGDARCDQPPSARERYHAAIAYRRPLGNVEPDEDPASLVTLAPTRVIE